MKPKEQRPEGQASNQPPARATSVALQKANFITTPMGSSNGKYLWNVGPQEDTRCPKPPSTRASIFNLKEEALLRDSWPINTRLKNIRYPQIVEVRPTRDSPIEIYLYDKTESLLPRPFWMDTDNHVATTDPQSVRSSAPRSSMGDRGLAMKGNHLPKPSFTINNSNHSIISCPHTVNVEALKQVSRIADLKEENMHRAASMTNNTIIINFKPHNPGDQDAEPQAAKSKSATDIQPPRTTSANRKGRVTLRTQRGSQTPGISALERNPPVEDPTLGIQPAMVKSDGDQAQLHRAPFSANSVQVTSSATLLEDQTVDMGAAQASTGGQATGDVAAEECAPEKENKPGKDKVSSKVTASKTPESTPIWGEVPEPLPPRKRGDSKTLALTKVPPQMLQPLKVKAPKTLHLKRAEVLQTPQPTKSDANNALQRTRLDTTNTLHPIKPDMSKTWPFKLRPRITDVSKTTDATKTVRFNIGPRKAAETPAVRDKSIADKAKLTQATCDTKNRPRIKSCPFMNNFDKFKAKDHASEPEEKKQHKDAWLSSSKEETINPQAAEATAVESLAVGTSSSTQDSKGDKAAPSIPKVVEQSTLLLGATDKASQHATSHGQALTTALTASGPAMRFLVARGKMTTKDATPVDDGFITIIVFAKHNLEAFKRQKALLEANISCYCPPGEKSQTIPNVPQREGEPKMPHSSPQVSAGPPHIGPGEHGKAKDSTLQRCPTPQPQTPNSDQSKPVSIPEKMPKLEYNFKEETPTKIDIQARDIHTTHADHQGLQQSEKPLQEQHLCRKDCHTSFLKYLLSCTEEPEPQQGFHTTTENRGQESTLESINPTTDYKEYLEICERLKMRRQLPTTSEAAQAEETPDTNQQASQSEKTHEARLAETWNKRSASLCKRQPLQRKLCDLGIQQLRAYQMRRRMTRKPGIVREVWYLGGFSIQKKKENSPEKFLKPLKPIGPAGKFQVEETLLTV